MKTQNQTPEKRNSQEVEKSQIKTSRKQAADEKPEQGANKLGAKKTMQPEEKAKSSKGITKH